MNWGTINNQGEIRPAQVSVAANGSLNKLILPGNYNDMFNFTCWNQGKLTGAGYIYKQNRFLSFWEQYKYARPQIAPEV